MGLLPEISRQGYIVQEVRVVNRSGKTVAGFPASVFGRLTGGRYVSLPRGDLAAIIFGKIESGVETIFGDSVACVAQTDRAVQVTFESGAERGRVHTRVNAFYRVSRDRKEDGVLRARSPAFPQHHNRRLWKLNNVSARPP